MVVVRLQAGVEKLADRTKEFRSSVRSLQCRRAAGGRIGRVGSADVCPARGCWAASAAAAPQFFWIYGLNL